MLVTPMFPLQVAMLPGEELPLRILNLVTQHWFRTA